MNPKVQSNCFPFSEDYNWGKETRLRKSKDFLGTKEIFMEI